MIRRDEREQTEPARQLERLEQLALMPAEKIYEMAAGYGFARRFVEGKSVLNVCWDDAGYGAQALAGAAGAVEGLTRSRQALDLATELHAAPNVTYRVGDLPDLPYAEGGFDAVVALRVIENLHRPEDFLREVRRVLKPDGVLVISTPDKQTHSNDRNRRGPGYPGEMYEIEFRELLERHFERVTLHRQGAAAGGFVVRYPEAAAGWRTESVGSSITPSFGAQLPAGDLVLAVCGTGPSAGSVGEDHRPYLLLDRDRRVFDECEERSEDLELLREEIRRMQETEVQAFQNARMLDRSEISYLRARMERLEAENEKLQSRLREMESSRTWRLFAPYRKLRAFLDPR